MYGQLSAYEHAQISIESEQLLCDHPPLDIWLHLFQRLEVSSSFVRSRHVRSTHHHVDSLLCQLFDLWLENSTIGTMLEASAGKGLLENWKCILACTLVSMSPFQYGIDFGAIGGLQAMKGFLEVGRSLSLHMGLK